MASPTTPIPPAPEPPKAKFKERKLPEEPNTDVAVELEDGTVLRERIQRFDHDQGSAFLLTYTKLDKDGKVMTTSDGQPLISPAHEVSFIGEGAERLGVAGIKAAVKAGREVGAARAAAHFAGIALLDKVMQDRLA